MNATDTKFRSRSGAARKKPITARHRAPLLIAAALWVLPGVGRALI
jgi:hypothetical protein